MARIDFVTLAVDDLDTTLAFYQSWLVLDDEHIRAGEGQAALTLEDGFSLVLYQREKMAEAAGADPADRSSSEVILSREAPSREALFQWIAHGEAAGGRVPSDPVEQDWGLSAFLADPDGHVWEVVWFFADGGS